MALIPIIDRNAPQPGPSEGRINVQTADVTRPAAAVGNALVGLGEVALKAYEKAEDDAAEVKSDELANMYDRERAERLSGKDGIIHLKGDTSAAYAKYDEDGRNRIQEIINQNGNLSARTKTKAIQKLNNVYNKYALKSTVSYGKQNADYIQETSDTRVGLLKNDLVDSASMISAGGENNYVLTDGAINGIIESRYKAADQLNIPRETVNLQIAKDLSEGMESTIMSLVNSGNVDLAQEVYDRYNNEKRSYLDAKSKPRVINAIHNERVKQAGAALAREAEGKENPIAFINKEKDDEIRNKALQNYNDTRRFIENERKRIADDNFNSEMFRLEDGMRSGTLTKTDLDNDQRLQSALPLMTPEQRKAIYAGIGKKKEISDSASVIAIEDDFLAGRLVGMTPKVLAGKLAGLSEKDYNTWKSVWREQNKDPESSKVSRMNWAVDRLYERMIASRLLKFGDNNKLTSTSQKLWESSKSNLIRNFNETIPKGADTKAYEQALDTFITDQVKAYNSNRWFGKIDYTPPSGAKVVPPVPRRTGTQVPNSPLPVDQGVQSQQNVPVQAPTQTGKQNTVPKDYTSSEIVQGLRLYRQVNPGSAKPTTEQLKKFMQDRGM